MDSSTLELTARMEGKKNSIERKNGFEIVYLYVY